MKARRLLTAGIWLATTAAATAMVWTATSVVAGDVTDRPAPVVAQRDVVQALAEEPPGPEVGPPPTTAREPSTATAPRPRPEPPPPAAAQAPGPAPTMPAPSPSTTTTTRATAVTTPPPTAPPAHDPTATYSTEGGVVTASCSGFFIRLVAATPTDGYAVEVLDRGPGSVHVHFVGRGNQESRVRLVCFGGRPIRVPDQHEESTGTSMSR